MVALLPNIAQHGSTAVRHLLLFTKWILEPTLRPIQARKVELAFMAETITKQTALQWDLSNNCVLQADNTLIGQALNDFPLYNLTTTTQLPTTVMTMAMPKNTTAPKALAPPQAAAHTTNNLDSRSNSTLSQGAWFMTTTTQIDAIAL